MQKEQIEVVGGRRTCATHLSGALSNSVSVKRKKTEGEIFAMRELWGGAYAEKKKEIKEGEPLVRIERRLLVVLDYLFSVDEKTGGALGE